MECFQRFHRFIEVNRLYFRAHRDRTYTIIYWLIILFSLIMPIFFPDIGVHMPAKLFESQFMRMILPFSLAIFLLWIWFKTGYTIHDGKIFIRMGPVKKTLYIDRIESIRVQKNII